MKRAAATLGLLAALGALTTCSAPGGDDSTADAVAMAVAAVGDAAPAVADAVPAVAQAVRADAALADRAREIIRPTCGSCHTTSSPQANPKALAVYDLDRRDWGATMTHKQLAAFGKRIAGTKSIADADRATLDEYVQALSARAAE